MTQRYAVVECEIIGHQSYGLLFEVAGGGRGFVDRADISDVPISPAGWPPVGQRLVCVVLGQARDGRIRASARAMDVALARSVADPDRALREWIRIRDEGFADAVDQAAFLGSDDAAAILCWALANRAGSPDRSRALDILGQAPTSLREAVEGRR